LHHFYASLATDGSVQVWDAKTHEPVGVPLVQSGRVGRVSFSPDDERVITPSLGGTARFWDVRTGLPLSPPLDHGTDGTDLVAYAPGGKFATTTTVVNSGGRIQRVWAAPPDGDGARTPEWLLRLATICAGQRLTDEGEFVSTADDLAGMEEVRRALAGLPENDPYAEWGRWFLSTDPKRPIAPGFTVTPDEAAKLRDEFTIKTPLPAAKQPTKAKGKAKKGPLK
jgi:hypothetical protein